MEKGYRTDSPSPSITSVLMTNAQRPFPTTKGGVFPRATQAHRKDTIINTLIRWCIYEMLYLRKKQGLHAAQKVAPLRAGAPLSPVGRCIREGAGNNEFYSVCFKGT
jgi:hypothetical protein